MAPYPLPLCHLWQIRSEVHFSLVSYLRISEAHVLRGRSHQPPRYEHRVFPAGEHPHGPVERRVRIRTADRLLECRGAVVMLVALAVVRDMRSGESGLHVVEFHDFLPFSILHFRRRIQGSLKMRLSLKEVLNAD